MECKAEAWKVATDSGERVSIAVKQNTRNYSIEVAVAQLVLNKVYLMRQMAKKLMSNQKNVDFIIIQI